MVHGMDADPHVFPVLHLSAGCGSSQTYLLFALASVLPNIMASVTSATPQERICILMINTSQELWMALFSTEGISSPELVLLILTWPNDDVVERPGIHSQIPLWVTILVDGELGRRKENAVALILVLIVDPYFTRGQIEGLRLRIPVGFSKSNPAIGNETDRPPCGSLDFMNVADVESQGARYRDMTHCLHLFEGVGQTVVLTFLKRLDQNLSVLRSGILVDHEPDGEVLSQLCARATRLGIDRLSRIAGESCDSAHG